MLVPQYHKGHSTVKHDFLCVWATRKIPRLDVKLSSGSERAEELPWTALHDRWDAQMLCHSDLC